MSSASTPRVLRRFCGEIDPKRARWSGCTTRQASRWLRFTPSRNCKRSAAMPIASPEVYAEMLDRAKAGGFAYPAINVTSSQSVNAALRGFAEAESDGIVQVSTGGAEFLSGASVKDMVNGAAALAEF